MMSDTCGPMSRQPFAHYDPASSSWRTSQGTLVWDWGTYSGTLPRSGSMRDGRLYEHVTPERPTAANGCSSLLGTPQARDWKGAPSNGYNSGSIYYSLALLPTPTVVDRGSNKTPDQWDEWTAAMQARHGNGNGHGPSHAIEAQRLLPTPIARDYKDAATQRWTHPEARGSVPRAVRSMPTGSLGPYEAACDRWAAVIGRPPPDPTTPGSDGKPRLNPAFVEWMMGLPEGHVTGRGLPRSQELKMLGNGVVPQQAALALAILDPVSHPAGRNAP